jgi:hypothetical protein
VTTCKNEIRAKGNNDMREIRKRLEGNDLIL